MDLDWCSRYLLFQDTSVGAATCGSEHLTVGEACIVARFLQSKFQAPFVEKFRLEVTTGAGH